MAEPETPKEESIKYPPENEMKAFSEAMVKERMITPDRLYVDLALLKDLHIGAIMAMALRESREKAERVYGIIQKNLSRYRQRYFFDAAYYFSETGYTEAQIFSALNNREMADDIYRMAPMTEFLKTLIVHMAVNANHSAVLGKTDDVTVVLNTYPLKLSDPFAGALMIFLGDTLNANVTLRRHQLRSFPFSELAECDEFYLYYIHEFSHHPDVHKALSEMKFSGKRIFAIPNCGYTYLLGRSQESLIQELAHVDTTMSVVLETFKFIPIHLCSPALPPADSPPPEAKDGDAS